MTTTQPQPAGGSQRGRRTSDPLAALLRRGTAALDPARRRAFSAADLRAGREALAGVVLRLGERRARLETAVRLGREAAAEMHARKEGLDHSTAATSMLDALEPQSQAIERTKAELARARVVAEIDRVLASFEPALYELDARESALSQAETLVVEARAEQRRAARVLAEEEERCADLRVLEAERAQLLLRLEAATEHARCFAALREADARLDSLAAACQEAKTALLELRAEVAQHAAALREAGAPPERSDALRTTHDEAVRLLDDLKRLAGLRQTLREQGGRHHLAGVAVAETEAQIKQLTLDLHAEGERAAASDPRRARLTALQEELPAAREQLQADDVAVAVLRRELLAVSEALGTKAYTNVVELEASVAETASTLGLTGPGGQRRLADLDARVRELTRREGTLAERVVVAERTLATAADDRSRRLVAFQAVEERLAAGRGSTDPQEVAAELDGLSVRIGTLGVSALSARGAAAAADERVRVARTVASTARTEHEAAILRHGAARARVAALREQHGFASDAEMKSARRTPEQVVQLAADVQRFETVLADARRRARAGEEARDLAWPDAPQADLLALLAEDAFGSVHAEHETLALRLAQLDAVLAELTTAGEVGADEGEGDGVAEAPPGR